ncbi:hypothetical protein L0657_19660 [Dyadobacter sp. CY345]|uniref:hypothetical protein n=1 Tax=Dyadobacter sp. CY345 TaxID=2909335 RepID=UPI001F348E06|nr:hypothetical protein [Dyadobacter sp. CY345]MCF2446184.1 hypothetical protein [Dyadobacter sp. CY345]
MSKISLRLLNEMRLIGRKQLRQKMLRDMLIFRNEDPNQPGIHILICKRDHEMAIISAMMINYLGNKGHKFIFHDDGSIDDQIETKINTYLPGIKLIRRKIADKIIEQALLPFPAMMKFRRKQVLAMKLIDVPLFSGHERIGYMDSDILFFQYPAEFFRSLNEKTESNIFNKDIANAYVTNPDNIYAALGIKIPSKINSGLWAMNRKDFDFERIESWLKQSFLFPYLSDYRLEQTICAMLAGTSDAKTEHFPTGYDVSFEKYPEASICKHYVGRIRYGYELEGLDYIIKQKNRTH